MVLSLLVVFLGSCGSSTAKVNDRSCALTPNAFTLSNDPDAFRSPDEAIPTYHFEAYLLPNCRALLSRSSGGVEIDLTVIDNASSSPSILLRNMSLGVGRTINFNAPGDSTEAALGTIRFNRKLTDDNSSRSAWGLPWLGSDKMTIDIVSLISTPELAPASISMTLKYFE